MRTFIAATIAVLSLTQLAWSPMEPACRPMPLGDGCAEVPPALVTYAGKLGDAIDADDAKAFLALLPSRVAVRGTIAKKAAIKKAIVTAGGVRAWAANGEGSWELWGTTVVDEYVMVKGNDGPSRWLIVGKAGRGWKLTGIGDEVSASYGDPMLTPARPYLAKLTAAIDGDQVKPLVALMPAEVDIGGTLYTRDQLRKDIKAHGGVDKAFGLVPGAWSMDVRGEDRFAIHRGDSLTWFELGEVDGAWQVTQIDEELGGVEGANLLHGDGYFGVVGDLCEASTDPTITIGAGTTEGELAEPAVRKQLMRALRPLRYCYEKALLPSPTLAGTFTVELVIGPAGVVKLARGAGLAGDLPSCVSSALKKVRFPAVVGDGITTAMYSFEAAQGDPGFHSGGRGCAAQPAALIKYARKLADAHDADDAKAFVALLPAKVDVDGAILGRAAIRKGIAAAGSLSGWGALDVGPWKVQRVDQRTYELYRGGSPRRFTISRAKGRWKLTAVVDHG